ncbi:MAG: tetratricopeptide repeat protein [Steroidobacteraceae bacterium]
MNRPNLAAALLGATLIGGLSLALSIPTPAQAASKPTVTRAFARPLKSAQDDLKKGKYHEALQQLDKARALPKPSPYDTHVINELALYAYVKTKDFKDAAKAMEATLDDGFITPNVKQERIRDLAGLYYQMKDYHQAAKFGEQAVKGGFGNANMDTLVSQAYYLQGDYKNTMRFTHDLVDREIHAGHTPKESQMQIVLDSCVKLNNKSCINEALARLVTYYPKPSYWQDIMDSLYQSKQAERSDLDMLNIYRLSDDVGAMSQPAQYIEMAQLALEQGSPGDAEQVLEKGYGKNVFTDPHVRQHADRLLANAKRQAKADQKSLPKLAAEAQTSATGEKDVAVGVAYLGYQQYDKAVQALSQGLMKGSVHHAAEAQLLLGVAQLKAGQKAAAIKSFKAVMGNPTMVQLAKLWSLRAHSASGTVAAR